MKTVLRLLTLSVSALLFTSCIQHSTVLRVRKDGSGEIFVRNHFSPQMSAMIGGIAGAAGAEGGAEIATEDPSKANPDELKANAALFGEGVRYVRHEENKNKDGWAGYLAVYEFDDITKITLSDETAMPSGLKDMAEEQGQEVGGEDSGKITFEMAEGVLTMNSNMGQAGLDSFKEQSGEELPDGAKPSQMMAMMAGMMNGMRMAYFVRIDGGIAETNATHVQGDFVTISDIDVGKMLADPEFLAFVDNAAANPDSVTEESTKALVPQIESMKAEMQEKVTVKFQ